MLINIVLYVSTMGINTINVFKCVFFLSLIFFYTTLIKLTYNWLINDM